MIAFTLQIVLWFAFWLLILFGIDYAIAQRQRECLRQIQEVLRLSRKTIGLLDPSDPDGRD